MTGVCNLRFISTNGSSSPVSIREAVIKGLADDGGLYLPEHIPQLPASFWEDIKQYSLHDIAFVMAKAFLENDLNDDDLKEVIDRAFTFEAPLKRLNDRMFIMELFHGPTLAFKDFGARFMACLFEAFGHHRNEKIGIVVATSGDTGSAVAQGFRDVEGVRVFLLYPEGKVSHLQEQQITTAGGNVTAIEVDGTFDDCQRMVKQAFSDAELNREITLSSANSINFARLLPQSFYYAYALAQLRKTDNRPPVFSVPSGNMGNLTGGLLAMKMGMPTSGFIAAVNANKVIPDYLSNGVFTPKPSVKTISNAMDVGDPSNLSRIRHIFGDRIDDIRRCITSYSYSDSETGNAIGEVFGDYGYVLDPHTAVGYLAGKNYIKHHAGYEGPLIVMATAHPAKFCETVEPLVGRPVDMPPRLRECLHKEKKAIKSTSNYTDFRKLLKKLMVAP